MKALIQTDYGDPAKVLELRDVPELYPTDGQAIVAMEAAVVHVADARTVLGMDGFRKKLPRTPGYEGVGRVSAVARDVTASQSVSACSRRSAPVPIGNRLPPRPASSSPRPKAIRFSSLCCRSAPRPRC